VLDEEQQQKEDHAIEELLAGYVPLLVRGDADGESHHKHSATDERNSREDTEDERETEDGFEERDGVAETEGEAVRQGDFARCSVVVAAKPLTPL
jgi:protein required for attachment to host cells